MTLRFKVLAAILVGAASYLAMPAALAAGPVEVQPHRGVYALELSEVEPNSTVVHARGRFDFEWADACDAWTMSQRAILEVGHSDGRVFDFGWTYNAWEAKDGATYRFFITRRFGGDTVAEEIRGQAELTGEGGGVARFTLPQEREMALPSGTLFPAAHTLYLLEALIAGNTPTWRTLFDGSGEEGLFGVSPAVAGAFSGDAAAGFVSPLLDGETSWRMQLAFFSMDESSALPEQEQAFRLFENGIVDEITFDYGEFTVEANLEELESVQGGGC
jgi:hypothetical protein